VLAVSSELICRHHGPVQAGAESVKTRVGTVGFPRSVVVAETRDGCRCELRSFHLFAAHDCLDRDGDVTGTSLAVSLAGLAFAIWPPADADPHAALKSIPSGDLPLAARNFLTGDQRGPGCSRRRPGGTIGVFPPTSQERRP
jgi:hypothetical protein